MTSRRLQSIDCLRAVAALLVCVGHGVVAAYWTTIPGRAFRAFCQFMTDYGGLGVPLFFVISGFCIHLSCARALARTGEPTFEFLPFWRRRIVRLYPTYFVVLCASMLLLVAQYVHAPSGPAVAAYPAPKGAWMTLDFAAHAVMAHGFFPLFDHGAGNPPFWTLAREEYLYVLYPVLLVMRRRAGAWPTAIFVFLAGAEAGPVLRAAHIRTDPIAVITASVLPIWIQWYLGAIAAEAYCGVVTLPWFMRSIWIVPLWLAAASRYPLYTTLDYGLAFFTLINWCVWHEQRGRWPEVTPMRVLAGIGVMSYSLYLVHDPVQTMMIAASLRVGNFATAGLYIARLAVLVAGSLAVARVLFVALESRFLLRGTRTERAIIADLGAAV